MDGDAKRMEETPRLRLLNFSIALHFQHNFTQLQYNSTLSI